MSKGSAKNCDFPILRGERKKWETNINACITIYSLINGNDDVIYGPVKWGLFQISFLWITWMYGHQVAWIDGHQAVMCLHYTVVEEVQKTSTTKNWYWNIVLVIVKHIT